MAPPDCEMYQSGRVLKLQNRDLWLRPTDISWHFHTLVTLCEELFKKLAFTNSREVEGQGDKIEEVKKKKKTEKGYDELNNTEGQPSFWSWQKPMTCASFSSSSWQQMSSDQTRERSDWQESADWISSEREPVMFQMAVKKEGPHFRDLLQAHS